MTTPTPRRIETTARYRTFVKSAILSSLRAVFSDDNPVRQFRNIHVVTAFPIERIGYPFILVNFRDSLVSNAGIGHIEYAFDDHGIWKPWMHYRFEGVLEFSIYALSAKDMDYLADALVELLAFGRLQQLTEKFFDAVYKNDMTNGGQLMLNTDQIHAMGDSVGEVFWEAEDTKVFQTGYWLECHGAFYNSGEDPRLQGFIDRVEVIPYIEGEDKPIPEEVNVDYGKYSNNNAFEDVAYVRGMAVIEAEE